MIIFVPAPEPKWRQTQSYLNLLSLALLLITSSVFPGDIIEQADEIEQTNEIEKTDEVMSNKAKLSTSNIECLAQYYSC